MKAEAWPWNKSFTISACGSTTCSDSVVVIPIVMGAHEDGLWWLNEELPLKGNHPALPDTVEAAEALFDGKVMRLIREDE